MSTEGSRIPSGNYRYPIGPLEQQLQQAKEAIISPQKRRDLTAKAILSVLQAPEKRDMEPRLRVVVIRPPMEDRKMQSYNYTVLVDFRDGTGVPTFLQSTREILIRRIDVKENRGSFVDTLVHANADESREENLSQRQRRLIMEVVGIDKKLTNEPEEKVRTRLMRLKYKKVLAYLHASLELQYQNKHLTALFSEVDKEDEAIELVMKRPKTLNLREMIRDPKVKPILLDNNNSNTTLLDRKDLLAKKKRYEEGSRESVDEDAVEICWILNITPPLPESPTDRHL